MREILHILLGAGIVAALALSLGSILLRRLGLALHRLEAALFGFLAGSACLSLAVFLLCLAHQARRGVFLWGAAGLVPLAIWQARKAPPRKDLPSVPRTWNIIFFLVFTSFFIIYFFTALAPEVSPDGMGYHLGNDSLWWRNQGFVWTHRSMYSYLSHGMEMLFLVAFSFGRHSAAAMVHLLFQAVLPLLILCYGRRFGMPRVGAFAAVLVYVSPVAGLDGASAYNDLTTATLVFAVFYLLQVWDETRDSKLLYLIGLFAGFCYAVKYTAAFAIPFAIAFLWWRSRRKNGARLTLRDWLTLAAPAALMIAPWVLRNWFWVGNPLAPFFNRWFPNPYYHIGMETMYVNQLRHYDGIKHFLQIPVQLTLRGGLVGGMVGPAFLLAPLALLSLRYRQGRRLLLAALVFAIPAYLNTGARFLIPCLSFVALALGVALANWRGLLPAIAIFEALACWPFIVSTYCDQWTWRISEFPVRAALRHEPEPGFIARHNDDYGLKSAIETNVPPGGRIFAPSGKPEAYIDRDIVVSYESTLGNLAYDMTMAPIYDYAPKHRMRFRFPPVATRGVRVVQTASAEDYWTVAEMRVLSQGRELPRLPDWRVSASPNGWEVQLAFDNSYATRWSTWQGMRPRDRLQIDFPRDQQINEVLLECAPPGKAHLQVEVLNQHGKWIPLTDTPEEFETQPPAGLRLAAMLELKARGIGFLLINDSEPMAEDMKKYPGFWGLTGIATSKSGTHLYRID
jgi:hypothetical protein